MTIFAKGKCRSGKYVAVIENVEHIIMNCRIYDVERRKNELSDKVGYMN